MKLGKVAMMACMVVMSLSAGVVSKNGIAKDSATGLMWQDEPYTQAEKIGENITSNGKAGNWNYAKAYCENLTLGGFSDWRLPNIYELVTLIDNNKPKEPYVINGIQNIAFGGYYWSSTTVVSDSSYAKNADTYYGDNSYGNKFYSYYVRCVKGKQLNFDNLVILKNKGKVRVSQKYIDRISPIIEVRSIKEAEISAKKETQKNSLASQKYPSWDIKYTYETGGSIPSRTSFIKCSNGKDGNVNYYYNGGHYIITGGDMFNSLEAAANHICGNR